MQIAMRAFNLRVPDLRAGFVRDVAQTGPAVFLNSSTLTGSTDPEIVHGGLDLGFDQVLDERDSAVGGAGETGLGGGGGDGVVVAEDHGTVVELDGFAAGDLVGWGCRGGGGRGSRTVSGLGIVSRHREFDSRGIRWTYWWR